MQTIDRLGQYKSACFALVAHAQQHPAAFASVELQPVAPPVREPLALPEHSATGLAALASELGGPPHYNDGNGHQCGENHRSDGNRDRNRDRTPLTLAALAGCAGTALQARYDALYLDRPAIHAEIQLVKFYAENGNPAATAMPRFIGCSKKTCRLCHQFLQRHGRFAVSRPCPSLYPRWTVPAIVCRQPADVDRYRCIVQHMSSALEASCAASLAAATAATAGTGVAAAGPAAPPRPSSVPLPATATAANSVRHRPQRQRSALPLASEHLSRPAKPRSPPPLPLHPPAAAAAAAGSVPAPAAAMSPTLQPLHVPGSPNPACIPLPLSRRSSRVQPLHVPDSPSPACIPLPSSRRSSRVPTPVAAPATPVSAASRPHTPLSPGGGGVPLLPTPAAAASPAAAPAAAAAGTAKPDYFGPGNNKLSSASASATPLDASATGVASMDVQISKARPPSPVKPTALALALAPTTAGSAASTSTSLPPTPTPEARERRRLEKGKFRALSTAPTTPRPRTPLGALNLTIERHAPPPPKPSLLGEPLRPKQAHWLDTPSATPPAAQAAQADNEPESEYTIWLAGNYADGMSLGDAVFSGKLSDVNTKGEIMQCRGFRLRSGLLKKRAPATKAAGPGVAAARKNSPLRVHEVVKTAEMMVIDIIFPDAVVRMEVFWDDEARSVV